MKFCTRLFFLVFTLLNLHFTVFSQNHISWTFTTQNAGKGEVDLIFTGKVENGWYAYSQDQGNMGPFPTTFTFREAPFYKTEGKAKESGDRFTVYDKTLKMNVTKFKNTAVFTQRIKVTDYSKPITGYITYITCNDASCTPPKDVDFKFTLKAPVGSK